jgi:hypothetical protein
MGTARIHSNMPLKNWLKQKQQKGWNNWKPDFKGEKKEEFAQVVKASRDKGEDQLLQHDLFSLLLLRFGNEADF